MNYNSVEEILNVEIKNMTVVNLDSYNSIQGVDWFNFKGQTCNNIYISPYSYIGFGLDTDHLSINCQYSYNSIRNIYREEGTLYNCYKFLKIRWEGQTYRSDLGYYISFSYNVILWDTGDISLYIDQLGTGTQYSPAKYYFCGAELNVTYDNKNFTFIKIDNNNFEIQENIIELIKPTLKYLIKSNNYYYQIKENNLLKIPVNELSAEIFSTYGTEIFPLYSTLIQVSNPEILCWTDIRPLSEGITFFGVPYMPQIILYESKDLSLNTGIERVEAIADANTLFSISFDEGATWYYYEEEEWKKASSVDKGMTRIQLNQLDKEIWDKIFVATTFKIRACIFTSTGFINKKIYFKLA